MLSERAVLFTINIINEYHGQRNSKDEWRTSQRDRYLDSRVVIYFTVLKQAYTDNACMHPLAIIPFSDRQRFQR